MDNRPNGRATQDEQMLESVRTVIRLARIAQQTCEEVGLTLPQYRALNAAREKRRAFELARATSITRPAMSALAAGLEKMRYLRRSDADGDGRGVYFVITPKGLEAIAHAERQLIRRFDEVLGQSRAALYALSDPDVVEALDQEMLREFAPDADRR